MKSRAGIRLRDTVQRDNLYHLALALRKEGRSYNQIIREIERRTGITLGKSHISGWVNGKHRPFGYVRAFSPEPSPELAYVIGVQLGDASMSVSHYNYKVKLRVIDREFAEEFSRCLSVLLHRTPPRVNWNERRGMWHTEVSSVLLQNFLRRSLRELQVFIEHCRECTRAFLRGFFDSEGSIAGRALRVYNGDLEKIEMVDHLLAVLQIETTGPHLRKDKGGSTFIKGKVYRVNKNEYYVYVRTNSLLTFAHKVGFTIARKSARLNKALSVTEQTSKD